MTATNPDATTNKSTITIKGTFFNSTFGAENNTVAIKVRWKQGNGTYSDWVDATATIKNNSVSATYEATLGYTKQWTIQASITDKLSTVLSKELAIRRALSESHLKSSAFSVEKTPQGFIFRGKGWGHGVGLRQIGAAVMASKGYDYIQILSHYYEGARVENL